MQTNVVPAQGPVTRITADQVEQIQVLEAQLGYDVVPEGRRLVINEAEAEQVREIFRIARDSDTLTSAWREIVARGFRTKQWTSSGGRLHGGKAFNRTTLRLLVSKVLYVGSVSYKG